MKKTALFITTLCLSLSSFARIGFGPEVGLNVSKLKFAVSASTNVLGISVSAPEFTNSLRAGGRFGGIVDIGIIEHLSVQPGVFYSMEGGNQKSSTTATIPANAIPGVPIALTATLTTDTKTQLNYLHVPLNIIFHYNNFFVGAGAHASYGLNGKIKGTASVVIPIAGTFPTNIDSNIKFGSDANSIKRIDWGATITAGYEWPLGLFFRGFYDLGLTELSNRSSTSAKNRCFGISVGYIYRRKTEMAKVF